MRFLFKVAFFLILLFLAVAYFAPSEHQRQSNGQAYSIFEGFFAVKSTLNDMEGFCDRNPQTCETGRLIFSEIKNKALDGARTSYEFLNEKLGGGKSENLETEHTIQIEKSQMKTVKKNDRNL